MKVKWLGHASFLITSDAGTRIITDPYVPGGPLSYAPITESADVVTVSHEHGDHNNSAAVQGKPAVVKAAGKARGIDFQALPTYHDEAKGSQRGKNTIFCFEVDGVRLCHLGDLGHLLSDKEVASLGKVDVLFIPVGGFYTIDAKAATEVAGKLAPGVVIPMHFKTEKCGYPIATAEEFLRGRADVKQANSSEVEFKKGQLPAKTQTIVLKPAL